MSTPTAPTTSSDKVVLHFLDHSRAETIVWILEELKVDYEIKYYQRQGSLLAPKALRDIHPLGKSPVIAHNDLVIAESGNIITYLLSTFGSDSPFSATSLTQERQMRNNYYLHYAEGSLMPILVNKLAFSKFPDMSPWYARPIIAGFSAQVSKNWMDKELAKHLAMIDGDLKKEPNSNWICGGDEPTAADFAMYFPLLKLSGGRAGEVPCPDSVKAWVKNVESRPALKTAYAKLEKVEKDHADANQTAKL